VIVLLNILVPLDCRSAPHKHWPAAHSSLLTARCWTSSRPEGLKFCCRR